jgi:CcmD family protein
MKIKSVCLISLFLLLFAHAAFPMVDKNQKPVFQHVEKSGADTVNTSEAISYNDYAVKRVMAVVLIIWFGISAYLFLIDRKIIRLEKRIDGR